MKSSNIIYLFDFDGTLFGQEEWKGVIKNWKSCFKSGPYINPGNFDIRWSILTGRPLIDKPLIWLCCSINGLFPEAILTTDTWKFPFKSDEDKFNWKTDILKAILRNSNKIINEKVHRNIEKVVYVDNDINTINYINGRQHGYEIIAITVPDFVSKNFNFII